MWLVRYVQSKRVVEQQSMKKNQSVTDAKVLESQWKQEGQEDRRKGMKRRKCADEKLNEKEKTRDEKEKRGY